MKLLKLLSTVLVLLLAAPLLFAQTTALHLNAYSGLFSYRGNGATSNSWLNFSPYLTPEKYTTNPYGKRSDFSYAFEVQAQRVTKSKFIYGTGISFEMLASKVHIDEVTEDGFIYWQLPASGKTTIKNSFVTLNPFVGHRYTCSKLIVDVLAGADLGFCLQSKEAGSAVASNKQTYTEQNDKPHPSVDLRPRIQIQTQLNKFGLLVGYSFGLTNYQTPDNPKAFSQFLRLGMSYQIK